MPPAERELDAYECPSCGNVRLHERATCCGESLEPIEATAAFDPPDMADVAREVFGISGTELAVCRTLMSEDEATVEDLASRIPRDRSVVLRHLNHLVDLGVARKHSRVLPEGGRVNVYAPNSVEDVRRRLRLGLYAWLADAEARIDELNREKFAEMVERGDVAAADGSDAGSTLGRPETPEDRTEGSGATDGDGRSVFDRLLGRDDAP